VTSAAARAALGLSVRAALALALAGCNGAFHFDGRDGAAATGIDGSAGTTAGDDACSALTCPWEGTTCTTACVLSCPANRTCVGSCGAMCNATCAAGSICTLTAGTSSVATCLGSSCRITLGEGGSAVCQDGATCAIVCTDDCGATCAADSSCTLQCPGAPAPITVTGTLRCSE
jgi:hypothetical protein